MQVYKYLLGESFSPGEESFSPGEESFSPGGVVMSLFYCYCSILSYVCT